MAFVTRSNGEILRELLAEFTGTGLSYTHRSSKAYALASTMSREIETAYSFFDSNFDKAFLRGASGQFLDALGELFGVRRRVARKCLSLEGESNVRFYVDTGTFGDINSGQEIIIPAGTIIQTAPLTTAQDPIQYELLNTTTLSPGERYKSLTVEAAIEGSASRVGPQVLRVHDFNSYTNSAQNSLKVVNSYAVVNGEDRQLDADMRFLISIAATAAQSGNTAAIRLATLSVPGVIDFSIVPYFDGIGSVGVFAVGQDNQPSPVITAEVQLSIDRRASHGIFARSYIPAVAGISFSTRVNTIAPLTINEQIELRQSLTNIARDTVTATRVGGDLDLVRLQSDLLRSDARIESFGTGTNFFDTLGVWHTNLTTDTTRERGEWIDQETVTLERHEVFQPEPSLINALVFNF